jgi:hypothetical protein
MAQKFITPDKAPPQRYHGSKIDGGVFIKAAKKYGLPTTNASLNKIVRRVNKENISPTQAAQKISQGK